MSLQIETQSFQFNNTVTGLSSAVFNSVSAVSLSGTFYGDGSKLTGVISVSGTPNQINASKSESTVTLSLPNSAVFPGDVSIIGNLTIAGSATYIDTKNLIVGDNIIYFNDNNYGSNVLDIGIVSHFSQAPLGYNHTGLIRRAGQGVPGTWTLFSGLTTEPASATNIDWNDKNIRLDSLSANLIGNVTGNADTVTNGVYTNQSYSDPSWITSLADTKITGTKFATNTLLQSTSALLTPLTITNTLTSQLVLNTAFNNYQTNVAASTATLLPTTVYQNASGNWENTYTSYKNTSASFLTTSSAQSTYAKLSSNAFTYDPSVSSIDTVNGNNIASGIFSGVLGGNCNAASGRYSTVVNAFSSCSTASFTFVGAGSGNWAAGNNSIVVGGSNNCNNSPCSIIGGGFNNCIIWSGGANITLNSSAILGGCSNKISNAGNQGQQTVIVGGLLNCSTSGNTNFIGSGYLNTNSGYRAVIVGGYNNSIATNASLGSFIGAGYINSIPSGTYNSIVGGRCNSTCSAYGIINGGLGNYNPLRSSIIGGGVANHTGGFAPFNITAAASISGNGTQTCLIGTGIQSCFSSQFASNNVSLYYATPTVPLSAGTFTTATIAATGTNYIIINGDYSTCTGTSLSANSIYVYDRAINNTGYDNVIAGGKLNTASGTYSFIGGGKFNTSTANNSVVVGGNANRVSANYNSIINGCSNTASGAYSFIAGGCCNNDFGNTNSFLLGSGLSANQPNFTYVNNLNINNNAIVNSCVVASSYTSLSTLPPSLSLTQTVSSSTGADITMLSANYINLNPAASTDSAVLMNLTNNGTSRFSVDNRGLTTIVGSFGQARGFRVSSNDGQTASFNVSFNGTTVNGPFNFTSTSNGSPDTIIVRDGKANTVALQNSTFSNTFRSYNTYTNAQNYERGSLTFSTPTSALTIAAEASGTGLNRDIWFNTAGTTKMVITSAGNIGIGTTTPSSTLTVVGSISATGTVAANPLAVANSQTAVVGVGAISGKFQIFDANGNSLGFVPIYTTIT